MLCPPRPGGGALLTGARPWGVCPHGLRSYYCGACGERVVQRAWLPAGELRALRARLDSTRGAVCPASSAVHRTWC